MAIDPDLEPILAALHAKDADTDQALDTLAARLDSKDADILRVLASLGDQFNAMHSTLKQYDRRLLALEGSTEPDPEPEPVSGTWFGVTNANRTGLSGYKVLRMFTGNTSPEGLNVSELKSPEFAKWVSWKPSPTVMENPSWAKGDIDYLKTVVPKSTPCFVTVWHEPEGNRPSGWSVDRWVKAWQTSQAALYDQCVQARKEGWQFWVAPIICDWTHRWSDKGSAEQWYSEDFTKYDVMGFDVYPTGQQANGNVRICRITTEGDYKIAPYQNATRWDTYRYNRLCADLARKRGKPWGSGECGIIAGKLYGGDSLHLYSLEQRAARFVEITDDLKGLPNPPLLWTWWNNDSASVSTRDDPAGRAAYNRSFAQSPAGFPTLG